MPKEPNLHIQIHHSAHEPAKVRILPRVTISSNDPPVRYATGIDRNGDVEALLRHAKLMIPDPAPLPAGYLKTFQFSIDEQIKRLAALIDVRPRYMLDETITTEKETTMNKNPLTSKDAKLTRSWQGPAELLSHSDIGKVVQVTTRDGVTVKDELVALAADGRGVCALLRHVRPLNGIPFDEFGQGADPVADATYIRIDPQSKVITFDVNWKDES